MEGVGLHREYGRRQLVELARIRTQERRPDVAFQEQHAWAAGRSIGLIRCAGETEIVPDSRVPLILHPDVLSVVSERTARIGGIPVTLGMMELTTASEIERTLGEVPSE